MSALTSMVSGLRSAPANGEIAVHPAVAGEFFRCSPAESSGSRSNCLTERLPEISLVAG